MIYHIIGSGRLEFLIDLTKKDRTCARSACEHTVHHEELLFFIVREEELCNNAVIDEGNDKTDHAKNEDNAPIIFKNIKSDRRDTCYDHHVEEEVAGAGHEEVIGVFFADDLLFSEEVDDKLNECCSENAEQKVEAVDHGAHAGQEIAEREHDEIREEIRHDDQRDLDGHLINAFLHGDLGERFYSLRMETTVRTLSRLDLSFSSDNIQVDDTANAGRKETKRCNGKTKAFAADKTEICFINITVIERLSCALTVAEGEKYACCR